MFIVIMRVWRSTSARLGHSLLRYVPSVGCALLLYWSCSNSMLGNIIEQERLSCTVVEWHISNSPVWQCRWIFECVRMSYLLISVPFWDGEKEKRRDNELLHFERLCLQVYTCSGPLTKLLYCPAHYLKRPSPCFHFYAQALRNRQSRRTWDQY